MAKDLNRVQLLGHLGGDPELRILDSGQALATLNVATSRRWKDSGGQDQEETEWSRIVAWGKLAEICGQYLHKGSRVYLEGRLRTHSWEEEHTGERRYLTEVVADELIMLDGRRSDGQNVTNDAGAAGTPVPRGAGAPGDVTAPRAGAASGRRAPMELEPGINPRPRLIHAETRVPGDDGEQDLPF
jgi:single-strand DNA-binding protein